MNDKCSNRVKNLKLISFSALLVALAVSIVVLNRSGISVVQFGNSRIPVASFSGVITVFMMLVCLAILNIDNKKGFAVAVIVNGIQLVFVSYSVFIRQNMDSVAGVPMTAGILGLLCMQHSHIKRTRENEKILYELSATDPLTGLYNRRSIRNTVSQKIKEGEPFSLVSLDLDNFKNINDTMGHAYGDLILCEAAKRWKEIADEDIYIGRTGGDEFTMIITGKTDGEVRAFAEKCLDVLSEKIHTDNLDYYATGSAGVAVYPKDGSDSESLFKYVDTAMYRAKMKGKNQVCLFDSQMLFEIEKDMNLENEIRSALKYNRFYLVFQPQFETETKRLRGFESLLRLKDENGKFISPAEFIPVAERSGLILEIDRWVLRHAMQSFSENVSEGSDFTVSVNISAKHITEKNLAGEIKEILEETGFPANRLEVEVTESCVISSVEEAIKTLQKIKDLGVKIALDDFGTGYASLSYLQRLPIDLLKIDKSFIDNMLEREDGEDFVKAIISIGHMFGCEVISEGVEQDSQLVMLRELKCDFIQGYIWGKPQQHSDAVLLIS